MITRDQVKKEDKWAVETLFSSLEAWRQVFQESLESATPPHWPSLAEYRGRLKEGPEVVKQALQALFEKQRKIDKLITYSHLRHDEDLENTENKGAHNRSLSAYHQLAEECSWFEPELLSLSDEKLKALLESSLLKEYHFYLETIIKLKKHTLPAEQERLIAMAGQALQTSPKAFSALSDADFEFGEVETEKGEKFPLTHGSYGVAQRSFDRTLRKNAFFTLNQKYSDHQNTFGELLSGHVQKNLFNAKARHYSSCVEAALTPNLIPVSVYHSLIKAVRGRVGSLHRYLEIRKKCLGLQKLHIYDLQVPLVKDVTIDIPYDEGVSLIVKSVALLGEEYQKTLERGLKDHRWVDRYENKAKRSGAYSSGCFDSSPYILMNYKGQLRDLFILAHEAGHSMHSFLSRSNQPYHYSDYKIFVAEVASTFNEELLMLSLLESRKKTEEKILLINQKLEDIRGTLFRQALFAEFELAIHSRAEHYEPSTPEDYSKIMLELNQTYYGKTLDIDSVSLAEWARIPHFYYNFYVYQYATGISAALALVDKAKTGSTRERDAYLNFLKGGSTKSPIELLKGAGVDMTTTAPIDQAIDCFDRLLDELEGLI